MHPLPPDAKSNVLSRNQMTVLNRIGEIFLPRNDEHPSFSELGCIAHVDLMVAHAPEQDMKDLKGLLDVLYFFPMPLLRLVVWFSQHGNTWPEPFGTLSRKLDLAFRSITLGLYYSGKCSAHYQGQTPLEIMNFQTTAVYCDGSVKTFGGR
jgi:hypothetical protein